MIAIFFRIKTHVVWKIEIIAAIVSQTSVFYITITTDFSLIYNSKDKVSERIILLEFSSYKSFFSPRVKIALERNG